MFTLPRTTIFYLLVGFIGMRSGTSRLRGTSLCLCSNFFAALRVKQSENPPVNTLRRAILYALVRGNARG